MPGLCKDIQGCESHHSPIGIRHYQFKHKLVVSLGITDGHFYLPTGVSVRICEFTYTLITPRVEHAYTCSATNPKCITNTTFHKQVDNTSDKYAFNTELCCHISLASLWVHFNYLHTHFCPFPDSIVWRLYFLMN